MKLRSFLLLASALLLAGACRTKPAAPAFEFDSSEATSRIATTGGDIAGYLENGIFIYKGIPYAKADRFMPAESVSWEGVRSCRAYGPTCPQGARTGWYNDEQAFSSAWNDGFPDEDCLRLNIWTPGIRDGKKRAVMVWLHGGGFHSGNGQEWPSYDGRALAGGHDVVVVTLNHRLNVLGHLDLSFFGEKYAASGNVGMTDIVKALEWVRDNIGNFGGDPDNVTIFGQSGGGGKVTTLMAMPSAKGLFKKAIVESGSITTVMDKKYSQRIGRYTVHNLGLSPLKADEITKVPYDRLLAACQQAVAQVREEAAKDGAVSSNFLLSILFGTEPTVDGTILPAQPGAPESMELSKDIPVIIGTTWNEFTVGQEDQMFKPLAIAQAKDRTAYGCAPVWMYRFDWESPVLDGHLGSSHCMEIPFVFDNVALHYTITGGAPEDVELGHRISRAWTNFAKTGDPQSEGLPAWPAYTTDKGETMIFNNVSEIQQTL
ncbi:MAG: carboxylesterase/lipase family protein [Bacteroidales bacterium]|nr:carboxylesterase/lipase family protein [Bacteroidales bacterium]